MEQPIIILTILAGLTLLAVIILLILYVTKEKKKAQLLEDDLQELKNLLKGVQTNIGTSGRQLTEQINVLGNGLSAGQIEVSKQVHSGFEQTKDGNIAGRNETKDKLEEIATTLTAAFELYSQKVDQALTEFSNDNVEFKKKTDGIKVQISKELQQILSEIKAPLDLD